MPIFVVMTKHSERDDEEGGKEGEVGEIEVEDGAKALNWRSDESGRRQGEFRATLPLHTTVCVGDSQTNSPGDRAVCLLIISGQDEPSSAVQV